MERFERLEMVLDENKVCTIKMNPKCCPRRNFNDQLLVALEDIQVVKSKEGKVLFDATWYTESGHAKMTFENVYYTPASSYCSIGKGGRRMYDKTPATLILTLRHPDGNRMQFDLVDTVRYCAFDGGIFTTKRQGIIRDVFSERKVWRAKKDSVLDLSELIAEIRKRAGLK